MNLTRREKLLLAGCVYILAIFTFAWFFYLPNSREITRAKDANRSLNREIEQLQKAAAAGADSGRTQEILAEMEAAFPALPDQARVMQVLNSIADRNNLVLKTMSHSGGNNAAGDRTGQLPFEVTFEGDLDNLLALLKSLRESERINNVDSIEFNALKKEVLPAVAASGGEEDGETSPPIYFSPPLTAPEPKSRQLTEAPVSSVGTAVAAARTEPRQSELLQPDRYEMRMQVVFYYYNSEKPAAAGNGEQTGGIGVKN
jgi:type II secretory pathway component PulM